MRTNTPTTPLLAILRHLTDEQREEFAELAGTKVSYLYQLASCARTSCRSSLAMKIEAASRTMAERYGSEAITMQELAQMCECFGAT